MDSLYQYKPFPKNHKSSEQVLASKTLKELLNEGVKDDLSDTFLLRKYSDALGGLLKEGEVKELAKGILELGSMIHSSEINFLINEFENIEKEIAVILLRAIVGSTDELEKSLLNGIQVSIEDELFRLTDKVL